MSKINPCVFIRNLRLFLGVLAFGFLSSTNGNPSPERGVTLKGVLRARTQPTQLMASSFQAGSKLSTLESYDIVLETSQGPIKVNMPGLEPEQFANAEVEITGVLLNNELKELPNSEGQNQSTIQQIKSAPALDTIGAQQMLVIPIRFRGGSSQTTFDLLKMEKIIFDGPLQKFYKEQSYGKMWFEGKVMDWVELPLEGEQDYWGYNQPSLSKTNEVSQAILDQKIDLSKYQRILYVVLSSANSRTFSTFGRRAVVVNDQTYQLSETWLEMPYQDPPMKRPDKMSYVFGIVLAHELGHTLGLPHANARTCRDSPLYGACSDWEYGSQFEVMGGNAGYLHSLHFNAIYKERLGWLAPHEVLTVTKNGIYTLTSLERARGIRALKIIDPFSEVGDSPSTYYVEFRSPIGFDRSIGRDQLIVHRAKRSGSQSHPQSILVSNKRLLNSSKLENWQKNAGITAFEVFSDYGRGVIIDPIAFSSGSYARVKISFKPSLCKRFAPDISELYTEGGGLLPGDWTTVSFFMRSGDYSGCFGSTFAWSLVLPEGWTSENPTSGQVTLKHGDFRYLQIKINIPQGTRPDTYHLYLVAFDALEFKTAYGNGLIQVK